jgi:DNA helicase-4
MVGPPAMHVPRPSQRQGGYPFAEERRLFYVALTRARRSVALFTVVGHRSSFLQELVSEGTVTVTSTEEDTMDQECPARRPAYYA